MVIIKQRGYILWAAALKWVMKWVNSIDVMRYTNKMADFEDHVVIFSIRFLCFCFLSRRSLLRQSFFVLMRTTEVSKAVLSTMMLISCRPQSVLHPREWIVLESGYIRETSDGLGKSIAILPCTAFLESTFEWASTPFKPFVVLCRIQKLMQVFLPRRTIFHKQTVMTDTFCAKANARLWSDCW